MFLRFVSRRDAVLLFLGAAVMYTVNLYSVNYQLHEQSVVLDTHIHDPLDPEVHGAQPPSKLGMLDIFGQQAPPTRPARQSAPYITTLKETTIMHHSPGWTIFNNLYMSNGTLFIVTKHGSSTGFPPINTITSTGLPADNVPGNHEARMPTEQDMHFISITDAETMWSSIKPGKQREWRVWNIEGNTVLFNDPTQFLRHYYHFVAELWFGVQAFWYGAFSQPQAHLSPPPEPFLSSFDPPFNRSTSSNPHWLRDNEPNPNSFLGYPYRSQDYNLLERGSRQEPPTIDRAIFMHANWDGWRDTPGFDSYFLRAAYPSLTVEHEEDWRDRIQLTIPPTSSMPRGNSVGRAWHLPVALLVDRTAAFQGDICGSQTQRTASQAWEYMFKEGRLTGWKIGAWWETVRSNVLQFAGVPTAPAVVQFPPKIADAAVQYANPKTTLDMALPLPVGRPVLTYISRQGGDRRALAREGHTSLVNALIGVARKRDMEFVLLEAEKLGRDDQLRAIARTTILVGVHGNGLSHLVFMPPTRYSTVIEIFWPGGFLHDYQWTSRALGMRHWVVWNDTYYTHPNKPPVNEIEGFHRGDIPVHGPAIATLIEDRLDGKI